MRMLNQRISVMNKYPYFIRPRNIKIVELAIQIFTLFTSHVFMDCYNPIYCTSSLFHVFYKSSFFRREVLSF